MFGVGASGKSHERFCRSAESGGSTRRLRSVAPDDRFDGAPGSRRPGDLERPAGRFRPRPVAHDLGIGTGAPTPRPGRNAPDYGGYPPGRAGRVGRAIGGLRLPPRPGRAGCGPGATRLPGLGSGLCGAIERGFCLRDLGCPPATPVLRPRSVRGRALLLRGNERRPGPQQSHQLRASASAGFRPPR